MRGHHFMRPSRSRRRGGSDRVALTASLQEAVLEATLERITYANEDSGYIVAKVDTGRGGDLVTVVGALLGARPGEALRLRGRWGSHVQFGRQFHVEDFSTVLPATVQGCAVIWGLSRSGTGSGGKAS